ncbi:transcriptional regulator [Paenibacillus sp. Root52]|uniref:MerR family transcriptional regulator n=1 Tax=Paenibacillus sp. Root52 TaxID=1736552 RepID=UPI0006F36D63|nr:MerR family transcriptional regulator [Paenibacillus sp. Root52]KQY82226.1 transcriptional regulator [Paenibacillus sp. Root52]
MNIKEAADRLGISARAIRFYEEKGLISPAKQTGNGYRSYTENDIWRLQTIAALREIGMSLEDIAHAIGEIDQGNQQRLEEYLELQQAVMYAQWIELKRMLDTTQRMIELNRQDGPLEVSHLHVLADSSRRLREARQNWHDRWNYDTQAAIHDERVQATNRANSEHVKSEQLDLYHNYDEALEQTADWISPILGEKGLDIGTGTGNLAGRLLQRGADMTAIDQSREMLRTCRNKYPVMHVKLGNFLALPFEGDSFDFVVSSFAFHHLSPDQQLLALEEMQRVLTSRGRICLTDLMFTEADHRDAFTDQVKATGQEEWLRAVRERHFPLLNELCTWLESHGYVTKHIRYNELLHTVLAVPLR